MATGKSLENCVLAIIGDEDTVTGFLLAGVGTTTNQPPYSN